MPWFRVDDGLADHPKVLGIPRRDRAAAMGLWALAGAWSAAHLTDGRVPAYLPEHLGCTRRSADVLVRAGLWSAEAHGWQFHAWSERQPSREQVESERLASKERQQRWRERHKQNRRSEGVPEDSSRRDEHVDDGVTHGPVTLPLPDPSLPDPTRPLPTGEEPTTDSVSSGARKRGTRLPDPFPVTPEMAAWARENAPLANARDHEQFCDYWRAKTGKDATKLDWVATWRNWMRRESDRRGGGSAGAPRGSGPGPRPGPDERAADVARLAADLQARQSGTHLRVIGDR